LPCIESEGGLHVVTGWDEGTQVAQDRSVTHEKRFLLSPVSAMFDQTEFIAIRICHHDPFEIVLAQGVGLELMSSQFLHTLNGYLKVGHVDVKVSPVFPLSWLRYFLEQHKWRLALASQALYVLLLEEHVNAENLGPKQAASFQMINVEDESAKRSDATVMCGYRHDLPPCQYCHLRVLHYPQRLV
jgi:hypothetical protein